MSSWQEVVTAAYIGTRRRPLTSAPATGSRGLDALLAEQADSPEDALLRAAAALTLHRRAGRTQSGQDWPLTEPHPPETRPRCNAPACRSLKRMLGGEHREALPEWLSLLDSAGGRLPEETLPMLLELGRQQANLQPHLASTVGTRGRWLARQNPDWGYLLEEDDPSLWYTGSRPVRLRMLARIRGQQPDQARELLAASWEEESPDERAELIEMLNLGLSMADEPFLEAALDDRNENVRDHAAALLAQLPESRFCQRMIARVRPLLKLEQVEEPPSPFRRPNRPTRMVWRIKVTLPQACDDAMKRDGIDSPRPFPFGRRNSEESWWLRQMLGYVPPSLWCQEWAMSPEAILGAVGKGDYEQILIGAFQSATQIHRDAAWAEALLTVFGTEPESPFSTSPTRGLMAVLPPDRREAFVLKTLQESSKALALDKSGLLLLETCDHPWSDTLSRAVLEGMSRSINDGMHANWQRRRVFGGSPFDIAENIWAVVHQFALHMNPELVEEASALLWPVAKDIQAWETVTERLIDFLHFRLTMRKELVDG